VSRPITPADARPAGYRRPDTGRPTFFETPTLSHRGSGMV
jgi:hypothetical protein